MYKPDELPIINTVFQPSVDNNNLQHEPEELMVLI